MKELLVFLLLTVFATAVNAQQQSLWQSDRPVPFQQAQPRQFFQNQPLQQGESAPAPIQLDFFRQGGPINNNGQFNAVPYNQAFSPYNQFPQFGQQSFYPPDPVYNRRVNTNTKDRVFQYPINMFQEGFPIPHVENPKMERILHGNRIIFYKLPRVYQQFVPPSTQYIRNNLTGLIDTRPIQPRFGVYPVSVLSPFNANNDFPWETTVGLNHAEKQGVDAYFTLNFLYVPEYKPILFIPGYPHSWIFPDDAFLGEIIYLKDEEQGRFWPLEVRVRAKTKSANWAVKRFAPIADKAHLVYLTGINYTSSKKYLFMRNLEEDEVFKMEGNLDRVPNLDKNTVRYLVNRVFSDCTNVPWDKDSTIPTSDVEFNIIPKDYSLGLLPGVDSDTCKNCHRQTQISVNNLIPHEPLIQQNQEKVGNIRGSDGIFSWYPFHQNSIRQSTQEGPRQLAFRAFDLNNGIIEVYNPNRIYDGYKLTTYVDESLKDYEKLKVSQFLKQGATPPILPKAIE